MLPWAFAFIFLAIVAAVFGFGDLIGSVVMIGKLLFLVFLSLAIISAVIAAIEPPDRH